MDGHHNSSTIADFDLQLVAAIFRRSLLPNSVSVDADDDTIDKKAEANGFVHNADSTPNTANDFKDVLLKEYIEAYNELNKMFPKLGLLFSFVAGDVSDKTRILSEHQSSPIMAEKFASIGGMLQFEKDVVKILDLPPPPSSVAAVPEEYRHDLANGSRTLLRLHRALLFVVEFIDGIRRASDHDKMSHLARKAYDDTLAEHHTWLVRKGVHMAIRTLPSRKQLLSDLAGADISMEEAERVMEETASAGRAVYDVVQKLYEEYGLLDLP